MTDFSYPTAFCAWGRQEGDAIHRVIDSGRFTQGAEVEAFEQEFAAYHGRAYGIMVNSGSSANLIAVAAMAELGHFKRGDRALVPAIAWSTTYAPLVQYGLDLVICDVDESWNASPAAFRHDPGNIKVVVACSILGNPAYLGDWQNVAGVLGAVMLEDNCESLGAELRVGERQRKTGTFGLMSTASFFWSHQIGAIEGGMILTDDPALDGVCRMLRAHGWTRDINVPAGFEDEYDFHCFGYNVRGLEMHAAIAREQLKKLPAMIEQRRANWKLFWSQTGGISIFMPRPSGHQSPFGIHFEVADGATRNRLVKALRAAGIDCRLPTGGSFLKQAYGQPWANQSTPIANRIHDRGMFLGNGALDLSRQIEAAVKVMREVL